jgi:D-citramalate synthase
LKLITQRIIELGDKRKQLQRRRLTSLTFWTVKPIRKNIVESYVLSHAQRLRPSTTLCLKIDGEVIEEHAQGERTLS